MYSVGRGSPSEVFLGRTFYKSAYGVLLSDTCATVIANSMQIAIIIKTSSYKVTSIYLSLILASCNLCNIWANIVYIYNCKQNVLKSFST